MKTKLALLLFISFSCTQFIKSTDTDYYNENIDSKSNQLNIFFSHNINGETHPCGCRNFPLGGIPQAYGLIQSHKKNSPSIYVDSGDTFFPLPIVPDAIKRSTEFTALKIAKALDEIGLSYITPGDQDFALGEDFLVRLAQKSAFKFLISNASPKMKIPHIKKGIIKSTKTTFYFIGVSDPKLIPFTNRKLFIDPKAAIQKQIDEINKTKGYKKIILLSHSGLDTDKKYAKQFPDIDWIIGAHSQSYLYDTVDIGNTKLVQVLSRNHFIGQITIPLKKEAPSKYQIVEMRDKKKDLLKANLMIAWLNDYKVELEKIQESEQGQISISPSHKYLPTSISCMECHTKQSDFWQGTSHSLAYTTLIQANATQNQSCVGCHSVGYKQANGFLTTKKIVLSEKENFDIKQYWKDFSTHVDLKKKSIRKLSSKERQEYSKKVVKFDEKHQITHNFSNVQCLNCHNQNGEHPFDVETAKVKPNYEKACLKCHTADQSPGWYNKDSKKLATSLNKKYFQKKLKQVSCPKIEKQ